MGYHNCIGRRPGDGKYPMYSGSSLNRKKKTTIQEKQDDGDSFGIHTFSPRSRSKVRDKATAFWRAGSGDRIFVTLTFIDDVTDHKGVSILNKFLTAIREDHPGFLYLWTAEHQKETGRIHFHLIANKRLPVKRYNGLWVLQQYNAGLRGKSKYGIEISKEEIESRYKDGTIGKVLNPFDVEKIKTIHGISWYITKYVTKQKDGEVFGCQTWHCSRRVSRLFTKETVSPSAFRYMLSFNNYVLDKTTGECRPSMIYKTPFFIMTFINNKASPLTWIRGMEKVNKWVLKGLEIDQVPTIDDQDYRRIYCNQYELDRTD